jgi:uncharacterized GH25 family protein
MRIAQRLATLASCFFILGLANAHDTFLVPDRGYIEPGSTVRLHLTSGMAFPTLDYAIDANRVQTAQYRLSGKAAALPPPILDANALTFDSTLAVKGLATVWIELEPKMLELESTEIGEYMDEIGATPELRARALATAGKQRWRERYTKHSKTFVVVGDAGEDRSWGEPVGMALEIVPRVNPARLHAGERLPLQVLKGGKPCEAFRVGIVGEGNTSVDFSSTDANGEAAFVVPHAGKWLLRGTDLRPAGRTDLEWESAFTTLTFELR